MQPENVLVLYEVTVLLFFVAQCYSRVIKMFRFTILYKILFSECGKRDDAHRVVRPQNEIDELMRNYKITYVGI